MEYDQILPAISKAMGAIKRIGKEGRNEHDKYNFASIDAFLEMANPICAEAGLVFHMQETAYEEFTRKGKYGDTSWIKVTYDITVMHVSGQTLPPVRRSVEVIRSGAQAYGSAQSYCLKQFLRSLLLIPTGDKDDADYHATGEGEVVKSAHSNVSAAAPKPKAQSRDGYATLAANMRLCENSEDLRRWWNDADVKALRQALPTDWQKTLAEECAALGRELQAKEAAPEFA